MADARELSIGIVVPVLNEQAALPRLLASLSHLGADDLLFVDGGSSDGTPELLQSWGAAWITAAPGRAGQMNAGAARLKSDVLLFLHADTELTPVHLTDVRHCMDDAGCIGGRFDVRLTGTHPLLPLIAGLMNLRSRLTHICTGDQAMFVRRAMFEQVGGFPEQPLMEDIELSRRLKRQGHICCLHRKVTTSGRRWQRLGVGRTIWLMWRLRLLYWLGMNVDRLAAYYRDVR